MPESAAGRLCQFPRKGRGLRNPGDGGAGLSPHAHSLIPAWRLERLNPANFESLCQTNRAIREEKVRNAGRLGDFR